MGPSPKRWRLRTTDGRLLGPFSTTQILDQIREGSLVGGEMVALEPYSKWIAIESQPEFYDQLLSALAEAPKPSVSTVSSAIEGVESRGPKDQVEEVETIIESLVTAVEPGQETKPESAPPRNELSQGLENVLEVKTVKPKSKSKKRQEPTDKIAKLVLGIVLLAAAFALSYVAFYEDTGSSRANGQARVRLISPRQNQPPLPLGKIKEKYQRAKLSFESDLLSGYQRAQVDLVEIVEGLPKAAEIAAQSVEIYQFLCLTYRELWPYAFQDSQDLKVVREVLLRAKSLDPSGVSGATCEIVQMLLTAQFAEADRQAESKLKEDGQAAVLFELRGDAYLATGDPQSAVNYFARARLLWPDWLKVSVSEAKAHVRLRNYGQAVGLLKEVVNRSPRHTVALIELALLEYSQFGHTAEAIQLLNQAFQSNERAPATLTSRGYMVLAQTSLKQGNKGQALQYAEKALALFPANPVAKDFLIQLGSGKFQSGKSNAVELVALGDQHARAGDCIQAQAEYRAAFDIDSKMGVAAMKAAKCLWALNQATEAIEWMRKAITAEPSLSTAYVDLADYYAQRYDFANAFKTLQRIQQLQPKNYEVLRGYAQVELRRNNFSAAVKYGNRALQVYGSDRETAVLLAKAHIGLREFQEAHSYASRILESDSSHIEGNILMARIIAGQQGPDLGVQYLEQLLDRIILVKGKTAPLAAVRYRSSIAELWIEYDRLSSAEVAAKQAVSIDPNNKEALVTMGRVLQAEMKYNDALESFLKAAVLDPSDADPLYYAGQVYIEVGRVFEAINMLNRVIRVNPRYPRAHVALGQAQLKQGNIDEAIREAQLEKEINPNLSDAYLLQAEAHFANKQYSDCASEYQKAAAKRPQPPAVLVRMARCYRMSGALDSAQSLLRRAQSIESGNPDVYKEQGAVFQMKGLADEAVASYDMYVRLAPNASDRAEVEARILRIQSGDLSSTD